MSGAGEAPIPFGSLLLRDMIGTPEMRPVWTEERTLAAWIAASISASVSLGIAVSTESATRASPPLALRETCMPAMLTSASPRMPPTVPTMPGRSS